MLEFVLKFESDKAKWCNRLVDGRDVDGQLVSSFVNLPLHCRLMDARDDLIGL